MTITNGALARLSMAEVEIGRLRDKSEYLDRRDSAREAEVTEIRGDIDRLETALKNNTRALWALLAALVLATVTISSSLLLAIR